MVVSTDILGGSALISIGVEGLELMIPRTALVSDIFGDKGLPILLGGYCGKLTIGSDDFGKIFFSSSTLTSVIIPVCLKKSCLLIDLPLIFNGV